MNGSHSRKSIRPRRRRSPATRSKRSSTRRPASIKMTNAGTVATRTSGASQAPCQTKPAISPISTSTVQMPTKLSDEMAVLPATRLPKLIGCTNRRVISKRSTMSEL